MRARESQRCGNQVRAIHSRPDRVQTELAQSDLAQNVPDDRYQGALRHLRRNFLAVAHRSLRDGKIRPRRNAIRHGRRSAHLRVHRKGEAQIFQTQVDLILPAWG